jgi:hypothetical protein
MVINGNSEALYINFIGLASAWMFYLWTKKTRSGRSYFLKMWKGVYRFNRKIEGFGL